MIRVATREPLILEIVPNGSKFTVVRCIGKVADLMMNQDDPSAKFCPILVSRWIRSSRWSRDNIRRTFAVKTYTTSTDIPSTDPNVPKVTQRVEIYPQQNRSDRWIAGVSTLYVVWIPMTMVKPGQSISITFKPHLVKPNWQAVDSFRLQDGGWIIQKCSTY
jgi:hypothetical protein